MPEYILDPSAATCWFCNLVFTRSRGKTQETPMMPAIPPLMIFGRRANCWVGCWAMTAPCSRTAAMSKIWWWKLRWKICSVRFAGRTDLLDLSHWICGLRCCGFVQLLCWMYSAAWSNRSNRSCHCGCSTVTAAVSLKIERCIHSGRDCYFLFPAAAYYYGENEWPLQKCA